MSKLDDEIDRLIEQRTIQAENLRTMLGTLIERAEDLKASAEREDIRALIDLEKDVTTLAVTVDRERAEMKATDTALQLSHGARRLLSQE